MKVLLLTTHLSIGGVAVYTVNLARGLKSRGIPVYIASSGGELVKMVENEGISHLTLNMKTKCEFNPRLMPSILKLSSFIKKNNIDIIHAQTRVAQIMAHVVCFLNATSLVTTCHGFFKHGRLSRRVFPAWGNNCIAISDQVRDHLVKDHRVKSDNVFLIYTGVDSEKFSAKFPEEEKGALRTNLGFDKSPIIGSVSRLSPVKGLRYLLLAMKDILREEPQAHLLLVGEGPSKDCLMELAKRLGIENSVFFALNTTETERFLSIIDVFVFCSLEEGLGLSLLEALASGKPCVASNVGGISSIIEDGKSGILVPPKDPHALKDAILKVLRDKNLKRSLSEKGSVLVKEKFTLNNMIDQVAGVYERAIKK